MSDQPITPKPIRIYTSSGIPPSDNMREAIWSGEQMTIGDMIVCHGMRIFPVGGNVLQITINLPNEKQFPYGFWNYVTGQMVFCSTNHPGLYLLFLLEHQHATPSQIVNLCFPHQNGSKDDLQKILGYTFIGFLELLIATGRLTKETKDALTKALDEKKAGWLKNYATAMEEERGRIARENPEVENLDILLERDAVLVGYRNRQREIREEFAPAEKALAESKVSKPYAL